MKLAYRSKASQLTLTDKRRITFYAATYGEVSDFYKEQIAPGAFKNAVNSTRDVLACLEHDHRDPFARRSNGSLVLSEDPHGLFASCWLEENERNDRILDQITEGKLAGCSFCYRVVATRSKPVNGLKVLTDIDLVDVSLVKEPSYPGTEVYHMRSMEEDDVNVTLARLQLAKLKMKQLNKIRL